MITNETRAESYKSLDITEKQRQVLECIVDREMTAREVSKDII